MLLRNNYTTGLQTLIDMEVSHVADRGLKFNPTKTVCMRYGVNPFKLDPSWNISGVQSKTIKSTMEPISAMKEVIPMQICGSVVLTGRSTAFRVLDFTKVVYLLLLAFTCTPQLYEVHFYVGVNPFT